MDGHLGGPALIWAPITPLASVFQVFISLCLNNGIMEAKVTAKCYEENRGEGPGVKSMTTETFFDN